MRFFYFLGILRQIRGEPADDEKRVVPDKLEVRGERFVVPNFLKVFCVV